jgi:50S ribosomal protein L16 3-hydroxylase
LLQGSGKRNWKISEQKDLSLVENAPLKILKNFKAEQEWTLEAGDMLYLPPQIAHWGISESDDCMTYSIGFRAPKTQELQHEFLSYLQDNLDAKDLYADPDLQLQQHPAEISDAMISKVGKMLQKITWDKEQVADFISKYLTEPKLDVVFKSPRKISKTEFMQKLSEKTLHISLKSQMLFVGNQFYLNGEKLTTTPEISEHLRTLADQKTLKTPALGANIHAALSDALYSEYLAGFLFFS